MEYNLIDPEDPTRKWVITIQTDGEVTQMSGIDYKGRLDIDHIVKIVREEYLSYRLGRFFK